jgi:hypothetical protein
MKQVLYSFLLLFFSSCEIKVKSNNTDNEIEARNETRKTKSDADILHDISLRESGGLKVGQAFLTFEDGRLLPKTHRVKLGETVLLNLVIDKGWEIRDGQASINATEIITTDQDQIVLNARNLFKNKPTVDAEDAARVVLKAVITKTNEKIDHFVVNYRLWDQWGDGEVKGSYRLYIDEGQADN